MSNQNRVQPGVPTGGQYAAAIKSDDIPVIHGMTGENLDALFEHRAATRAGLEYSSAKYIADLMAKSPEPVYEENAATLAAANAVAVEDIKHIDRVFNHGERPLQVAAGAEGPLADKLSYAGLEGTLAPYTGTNPDAGANPLLFTSASGRELIVSDDPMEGFQVMHDDRFDEDTFTLSLAPDDSNPLECGATVRDALWQLAVTDAASDSPTALHNGDFYELRDLELATNHRGEVTAELRASNDDGMHTLIAYNFETKEVDVLRDDDRLTGLAADYELAATFEGLHSEPSDGDFYAHTATYFRNLLTTAARHQDAPAWARTAANHKEITK
jgi:hypothetical protein